MVEFNFLFKKTSKRSTFKEKFLFYRRNNLKGDIISDVHKIDIDLLCQKLNTNKITGLRNDEAMLKLEKNGLNELSPYFQVPFFITFLKTMCKGTSILLWIGAGLCLISALMTYTLQKTYDNDNIVLAAVLIIIIFITALFVYYQEKKTFKILESFMRLVPLKATVIRDGKRRVILSRQLVVGDLVEIKSGDRIPADIRLIETKSLKVDNSPMTGESEGIFLTTEYTSKNVVESKNMAFFFNSVLEGTARGIVVQCGDNTVMGHVAALTARLIKNKSPLSNELSCFMRSTTIWAFFLGGTFGVLSFSFGHHWFDALLFIIGIIVANIPEGLNATITVSLAVTARKMASKNCLVKNLEAVETLGTISIICSDKTGTLTQNKMTTSHIWFDNRTVVVDGILGKNNAKLYEQSIGFNAILRCTALCIKAEFSPNQERVPVEKREIVGNASEAAILKFITLCGIDQKEYLRRNPKLIEQPFSSTRKYQMSVHALESGNCLLVMMGAPEQILERCEMILLQNVTQKLSTEQRKICDEACIALAENGERVLGFCDLLLNKMYTINYPYLITPAPNFPSNGFRFLGFVSLIDPPRPQVFEAVQACKSAGIKIVMVTGDHPVTAKAIARKVGIITDMDVKETTPLLQKTQSIIVPGSKLSQMKVDQLDYVLKKYEEIVFARVTPTQKLQIVESCQRLGKIVAATGDGVNDAPALKKADVGIAMGICGTEVAKQSADVILLDDNFASIVMGIEEGRKIFDNMKKSAAYILSSNVAEIVPYIAFVILNIPLPIGIVAVLSIDLLTDMLPAISLAYECPESDIMKRPPRNPKKDILVTSKMYFYAYGHIGMVECAAAFFVYFIVMAEYGFLPNQIIGLRKQWSDPNVNDLSDSYGQEWSYKERQILGNVCSTTYMVSVVVTQIANIIACRTRHTSIIHYGFNNYILHISVFTELFITCILIYAPIMKNFKFHPIKWQWWCYSLPFAAFIVLFEEWRKWNIRRCPKSVYFNSINY